MVAVLLALTGAAAAPQFPVTPACTNMVRELGGPAGKRASANGLRYVLLRHGTANLQTHNVAIVQYLGAHRMCGDPAASEAVWMPCESHGAARHRTAEDFVNECHPVVTGIG
jgi:hypothetical protein